jgi:hypothetical protein
MILQISDNTIRATSLDLPWSTNRMYARVCGPAAGLAQVTKMAGYREISQSRKLPLV